jgi:hypothetical protein
MAEGKPFLIPWGIILGLLLALPLGADEEGLILTNAGDRAFKTGQRIWFSVPPGDRLRILVDGAERYRGGGSASVDLDVPAGEEQGFRITAERSGPPPQNRILETRSFFLTIDKKAPEPPRVILKTAAEGFVALYADPEPGIRAAACAENGDTPVYIEDLSVPVPLAPVSFSALVWSVDAAGNASAPLPLTFDFPGFAIENPVPGTWANPQRLFISGAGEGAVFWTDDGSDPLGPAGRPYTGPALIGGTGDVTLRAAYRHRDGHIQEEKVVYRVAPDEGPPPNSAQNPAAALFSRLRSLEEREIRETMNLPLPDNFRWSIGGEPQDLRGLPASAGGPVIRPQPRIGRTIPLHLSAGGGVYRFILTLNGGSGPPGEELFAAGPAGGNSAGERPVERVTFIDGGAPAAWEDGGRPKIVYAGSGRVLVWSPGEGEIRYAWNNDASWNSGAAPVCIPPEGGVLRWIIDRNDYTRGPFTADIEARSVPKSPGPLRGRYAYRYVSPRNGSGDWRYAPGLFDAGGERDEPQSFDVCDGEDMEWRFITQAGETVKKRRIDRLLPLPPELSGPGEGEWRRGPVRVSAEAPGEAGEARTFMTARLYYASGLVEEISGPGPLDLKSAAGEYADVRLEARVEDPSGNRGPPAVRRFILDPLTVYVSAAPAGEGAGRETGGRDRPFRSLETALDFARREGRQNIFLNCPVQLQKNIVADGNLVIDGSFDERWERKGRSSVTVFPGVSLTARKGTLSLRGLDMERRAPGPPFLRALKGAGLEITGCGITQTGAVISIEEGTGLISGTRITALMTEDTKTPAVQAAGSRIKLVKNNFQLDGGNGLFLDMRGGFLDIEDTQFRVNCRRTGTAVSLDGVKAEWKNLIAVAAAGDYCSAVEIKNSDLTMTGGSVWVSARDAVAVFSDTSETLFLGTQFLVSAAFVSRVLEARNIFPKATGCLFIYSGAGRRAEVFSGLKTEGGRTAPLLPEPGAIGENIFQSFTHILGDSYPVENLAAFNRRFAPPGRPNLFRAAPPAGESRGTSPGGGGRL